MEEGYLLGFDEVPLKYSDGRNQRALGLLGGQGNGALSDCREIAVKHS